jgi:hypothetical protein
MISKLKLKDIINKYYLGTNESVIWNVKNKKLEINFNNPTKDLIGNITSTLDLEDCKLPVFNTKKLLNLVSICDGDLLLEPEMNKNIFTKLKISDNSFNLIYALADELVIPKSVSLKEEPEWDLEFLLEKEDISNLLKAQSAMSESDVLIIKPSVNALNESVCEFVFGDEEGYNNKINYHIVVDIPFELDFNLPFSSLLLKNVLYVNKESQTSKMKISTKGLLKLEFEFGDIKNTYYIVRKQESQF